MLYNNICMAMSLHVNIREAKIICVTIISMMFICVSFVDLLLTSSQKQREIAFIVYQQHLANKKRDLYMFVRDIYREREAMIDGNVLCLKIV